MQIAKARLNNLRKDASAKYEEDINDLDINVNGLVSLQMTPGLLGLWTVRKSKCTLGWLQVEVGLTWIVPPGIPEVEGRPNRNI